MLDEANGYYKIGISDLISTMLIKTAPLLIFCLFLLRLFTDRLCGQVLISFSTNVVSYSGNYISIITSLGLPDIVIIDI